MTVHYTKAAILDKDQLISYFASASVPRHQWKTGLECEVFAVRQDSLTPVPYSGEQGIEAILKQLAEKFGWSHILEGSFVIGLEKGPNRVTLEPGGQIEFSGQPHSLISNCMAERDEFFAQLKEITHPMGIGLMFIGYQPVATLDDVEWIPKDRYRMMSRYFTLNGGQLAHHMMKLTTSVQASLDYENEEDFSLKIMLASYLTPVLQAIYANSPFARGSFSGSMGLRGLCWEDTDRDRCGLMERAFSGNFGFGDYVEYLLRMPMIVRFTDEGPIPMKGVPFKKYMESHGTTLEEWDSHVSFAFPEVRLRKYLELRMCDSVAPALLPTLPALLKGLLYDRDAQAALVDIFRSIPWYKVLQAYKEVHQMALEGEYAGRSILYFAREILSIAEHGLANLGREGIISNPEEQALLEPLKEQLWEKGMSPAQELVLLWEEKGRDILKIKDRILI